MTEIAVPPVPEKNPLGDVFSRFISIKAYFRTRRAIRSGEPLFDYDAAALNAKNYVGPWSFNLQESAIAALPTAVLVKVLNFFFPPDASTGVPSSDVDQLYLGIVSNFAPFLPALTLTAVAWLLARCSMHSRDITSQNLARARYAYLYFDGAFGLLPQAMAGLGLGLMVWAAQHLGTIEREPNFGIVVITSVAPSIIFVLGSLWLLKFTSFIVPEKLFVLNGYTVDHPAPRGKYTLGILLGAPATAIIVAVVMGVLAALLASALVWIRSLVV